ncbi:MAG: alpha/beta fold hydrolase, partial [Verrucomicrobiota bacterium]
RKEPLIMVHGLLDSPLAWSALTNELRSDPKIRSRYQIWHFLYNTSAPALYSGRLLRNQYKEMRREFDPGLDDRASRRTTLLAHSMGGIVARGLITDPGDAFWEAGFTRPLSQLKLNSEDRAALVDAFLWKPEPSVQTVIFIATPHRGSTYADNPVGRLGQALVQPPNKFKAFYERVSKANPGAFTEAYAELGEGRLDSVGALSPRQPTLQILAELPLGYHPTLHSIIGDRGKEGPLEESSDGIVPYWSSHLENAKTETIVPAGHSMLSEPEVIERTKELLLSY